MCDRIIVHLYYLDQEKEQHIVATTIYVSTGTIFVQGKCFQQYSLIEFPLLLWTLSTGCKNWAISLTSLTVDPDLYTSTLPSFLEKIPHPMPNMAFDEEQDREEGEGGEDNEKGIDKPVKYTMGRTAEIKHSAEFCKSVSDAIQGVETQSLVYTPARQGTLTTLRNSVAAMESDFVSFKMEILQSFHSLESTVVSNNGEMKDKITQLDNNSKLRIKSLEEENKELSVSNGKLMEEVSKLSLAAKKLQDQISSMHKENGNLAEQQQVLKQENEFVKMELKSLKQRKPKERQEVDSMITLQQSPDIQPQEESSASNRETINHPNLVVSTDVPLNNTYKVLQDVHYQNTQDQEITNTKESSLLQRTTTETGNDD